MSAGWGPGAVTCFLSIKIQSSTHTLRHYQALGGRAFLKVRVASLQWPPCALRIKPSTQSEVSGEVVSDLFTASNLVSEKCLPIMNCW